MKTKQVIILRKDLNMRKGKMVAQGSHASMAVILNEGYTEATDPLLHNRLSIPMNPEMENWISGRFTKICVSVNSEEELLDIHKQAIDAGLLCSLIQDAGLTEFDGIPTYTAVAIGPADSEAIDKITSELKLL
jgi:PTH2 family peptidyl-tRNA hydrolase